MKTYYRNEIEYLTNYLSFVANQIDWYYKLMNSENALMPFNYYARQWHYYKQMWLTQTEAIKRYAYKLAPL